MEKCYKFIESKHQKYRDEYYLKGLCLIVNNLQLGSMQNEAYYFLYKARKFYDSGNYLDKDPKFRLLYSKVNGSSLFHYMQYDQALQYAKKELSCKEISSTDSLSALNMIGLTKNKLGELDSSLYYYAKGNVIANRIQSDFWIALISGNMGNIFFEKKDYKNARKYSEVDVQRCQKIGEEEGEISGLLLLTLIDLEENRMNDAEVRFSQVSKLIKDNQLITLLLFYEKVHYKLLEKKSEYKGALEAYKKFSEYTSVVAKNRDIEHLKRTSFQIEFEQKNAEIVIVEEKKKRVTFITYSISIFALIGMTALIVIIYQIIRARRREGFISLLQQKRLDEELKRTELEMKRIVSDLIDKNEMIELLNTKLDSNLEVELSESVIAEKQKIKNKLTTYTLLTEDDWISFKRLFESLNPGFFEKLQTNFIDLTNAEIRLITLTKLNLDTIEMSRALGISPDSVRKTNLRLRKKIGIEMNDDLVKFIMSL
jgi:DNA-binding CsgD family transcriptional regulator